MKTKRKMKPFSYFLLAFGMTLSLTLAGCSDGGTKETGSGQAANKDGSSGNSGSANKAGDSGNGGGANQKVELKAFFPGDTPVGFDEVMKAVNDKLSKDIGATLKIQFIPWSDYNDKTTLMLTAGDNFDMLLDAPWIHMNKDISDGTIIQLDDLIKNASNLQKTIPQQMLDANKFNGKVYGIPLGIAQGTFTGFMIRKDLREKYGLPPIQNLQDLEKFLYTVKEKEKDIIPFGEDQRNVPLFMQSFNPETYSNDKLEVYSEVQQVYGDDTGKFIPAWEAPGVQDTYKKMTQYYKDGIFEKNLIQQKNFVQLFNQGKFAATRYSSDGVFGMKYLDTLKIPGAQLEIVVPYKVKPRSTFKQWNFLSIPKNSKHADLVIKLMDWLSVKANHDLLQYGIEGKDWQAVGDNGYHPLSKYVFPGYVITWRPSLERMPDTMLPEDKEWVLKSMKADSFTPSVYTGFTTSTDAIKTELAKLNTMSTDISLPLAGGVLPFDEGIKQLKQSASSGGIQKAIDNIQKQYNDFKSQK